MRRGFTMLELVFVIVVLGILASIAGVKIFATRDDALIARARNNVASIRSGIINKYSANMMRGSFGYPAQLEKTGSSVPFDDVIQGRAKDWTKSGNNYTFKLGSKTVLFTYDSRNGTFDCPHSQSLCKALTE